MNNKLGNNTKGASGIVIAVVVIVIIIAVGSVAYYLLNSSSDNISNNGGNDSGGGGAVVVEGKLATNTVFTYDCYIGGALQGTTQITATITGESGNNYVIQLAGKGTGMGNPLNFSGTLHTFTLLMDKGTGKITLQSASEPDWWLSQYGSNAVQLLTPDDTLLSITLNIGSSATMGEYITNIIMNYGFTYDTFDLLLSSSNIIYN